MIPQLGDMVLNQVLRSSRGMVESNNRQARYHVNPEIISAISFNIHIILRSERAEGRFKHSEYVTPVHLLVS